MVCSIDQSIIKQNISTNQEQLNIKLNQSMDQPSIIVKLNKINQSIKIINSKTTIQNAPSQKLFAFGRGKQITYTRNGGKFA